MPTFVTQSGIKKKNTEKKKKKRKKKKKKTTYSNNTPHPFIVKLMTPQKVGTSFVEEACKLFFT